MTRINIVEAVNKALLQEMETDQRVVVMGEDVGVDGGVFRATDGLYKRFGEKRVIDTPLSESGIVGTAIGMAMYGLKPVTEIQFDGFMHPAFDQIVSHASRIRNRTRGRYTCPIVVRAPYGGGIRALEHHNESPEAFYAHVPGLKVVIPSTPYDTKGLLVSAIRDPDPVIFLEPKKIYRAIKEEVPDKQYTVPIGKANTVQEGTDVTVISWGSMMHTAKQAVQQAGEEGTSVELVDVRTISPCDWATIIDSVKKTGRAVIVQEAPKTCGFGAEVAARIGEQALLELEAPVVRVAGWDTPFPYFKMEEYYLPNANRILNAVRQVMEF